MGISLYVDPGYVDDEYVVYYVYPDAPSWSSVPVTQILPSYLYQQYKPDDNVEAFFTSYNTIAQEYLFYLISLNLPIWVSDSISGTLLDWVALNLYGFYRPVLTTVMPVVVGGTYNNSDYNTIDYNSDTILQQSVPLPVNDDLFKRCLTWNLYKGDGFQFTKTWLKNRVQRFLSGINGVAPFIDNKYNISITYAGHAVTISIAHGFQTETASLLQIAINEQVLNLPFEYTYTVNYS